MVFGAWNAIETVPEYTGITYAATSTIAPNMPWRATNESDKGEWVEELPGRSVRLTLGLFTRLASTVPARVLGERGLGRLRVGACADLIVLDRELHVRLTMVGGVVKFRRE